MAGEEGAGARGELSEGGVAEGGGDEAGGVGEGDESVPLNEILGQMGSLNSLHSSFMSSGA